MNEFKLSDKFLEKYKDKQPEWGFNGLGYIVYKRTYSRIKEDGKNEEWWETCQRVVEGTYNMQKEHIDSYGLGWNSWKAQASGQEMYERMFNMKFLPPGRGLWIHGTKVLKEKNLYMGLNNCSFVSTENIKDDVAEPFCFLKDVSMIGVGCGFDTKGAGKIIVKGQNKDRKIEIYEIPDTREGWVQSVRLLIESYFLGTAPVEFTYDKIRPNGLPIKGFGGISSGPGPLKELHKDLIKVLDKNVGQPITSRTIVDIQNLIGKCVIAGNVRRTAEIVFGDYNDDDYINLKNYKINPEREAYGWSSNNSIFAELGMDYSKVAERIRDNGEPGLAWLENMQAYSRMRNGKDYKDHRASGGNPCFVGYNKLLTTSGYLWFEELAKLDYSNPPLLFINKNGEKVLGKVWCTGEKETIALSLSNKDFLECTPNHVLMDTEGNEVQAKDSYRKRLMPYFKMNNVLDDFVKYGFIQGDGSTGRLESERHLGLEIHIGSKDADIANLFKIEVESNKRSYYTQGYNNKLIELGFSSKQLPERELPTTINEWSFQEIASFLKGLYSANGSVIKGHRVALKSTCKKMIYQVKEILSSLDIPSYITTNKPTKIKFSNGEYICKESYDLNICKYEDVLNFAEYIGFVHDYKQEALKQLILDKAPKVMSIKETGVQKVYDFSLEGDTHWGIVNNYVVHNCLEQTLESYEVCNLVETFPCKHGSLEDYLRTLKFAYLYAKTVTLGKTHWAETNKVMLRNRRIGCSVSGIAQFISKHGLETLREWMDKGYETIQEYDIIYSDWLAIPRSIKMTSVKPSGTVSLLNGSTPGVHFPESRFYIRRIRLAKNSSLIKPLKKAGYFIEDAFGQEDSTVVVEIPIDVGENVRTLKDVSMWEQLSLAAFMQKYWADNQVSCTITFDPEKEGNQIEYALDYFQYQLKGISFLPRHKGGAYKQMPYEEITEEKYKELTKKLKPIDFSVVENEEADVEKYCDSQSCLIEINK